ncbi:MAG TPA: YtxH domain-containing protein [Candidatus Saccharimonadales bacterium]|nr:YtxH domain-containing protein [Candidatus Saccharimonadales bacterium]
MRKTTKQLAIGGVVAAAAGYVAGILTAPKSGKETRKDIKQKAAKAKSDAEKQLKSLHHELGELIAKSSAQTKKLSLTAKRELTNAIKKAKVSKEKAKQILSAVHEGDAEDRDLHNAVKEAAKAVKHLKKFVAK